MERFVLSKEKYELLKQLDLSEMSNDIVFYDGLLSFDTSNSNLLLVIISENISAKGLNAGQETCNAYGRKLYSLYDDILYQ